jgi:hypothetical protein
MNGLRTRTRSVIFFEEFFFRVKAVSCQILFRAKKKNPFIKSELLRSPNFPQSKGMISCASYASTPETLIDLDRFPISSEDPAERIPISSDDPADHTDRCEEIGSKRR